LLCINAQTYNIEGSLIFNDSVALKEIWGKKRREMEPKWAPFEGDDEPETASSYSTPAPTPRLDRTATPTGSVQSEESGGGMSKSSPPSHDQESEKKKRNGQQRKGKAAMHALFIEDEDEDDANVTLASATAGGAGSSTSGDQFRSD